MFFYFLFFFYLFYFSRILDFPPLFKFFLWLWKGIAEMRSVYLGEGMPFVGIKAFCFNIMCLFLILFYILIVFWLFYFICFFSSGFSLLYMVSLLFLLFILIVTCFFIYCFFRFMLTPFCCLSVCPFSIRKIMIAFCFLLFVLVIVGILLLVFLTDLSKGPIHEFFVLFNKVIDCFGYFTPLTYMCFVYAFIFSFIFIMQFFFSQFRTGRWFNFLVLVSIFSIFFMCFLFLNFPFYTFNFYLFYFGSTCLFFSFITHFVRLSGCPLDYSFIYLFVFIIVLELFFWTVHVIYHSTIVPCPTFMSNIGYVLDFYLVNKKGDIMFFRLKDVIIGGTVTFKYGIIFFACYTSKFFKCNSIYVYIFYSITLMYFFVFYFMYLRIFGPNVAGVSLFVFALTWFGHIISLEVGDNGQTEKFLRSFSGSILFYFFSILFYFETGFTFAYISFFTVSYSLLLFFNYLFFYMAKNKVYNKNPVVFYLFFSFFFVYCISCYFIYFGGAYFASKFDFSITCFYYFYLFFEVFKNFMFYFFFFFPISYSHPSGKRICRYREGENYRILMRAASFFYLFLIRGVVDIKEPLLVDDPLLWLLVTMLCVCMPFVFIIGLDLKEWMNTCASRYELKCFYKKYSRIFVVCFIVVFFLVFVSYIPDIVSVLRKK